MAIVAKLFIPIILPLLGKYIEKYFKGKEAEQFFLRMVNEINGMGGTSVKLSDDYMAALDKINQGGSEKENART